MLTLHLTHISQFEIFPSVSKVQWWVFSRLECTSSYTNKYPPKVIIFGYFSPRTWLYFCIVFIGGIETCSRFDVTELIRPSLFSPGHDFKSSTLNPNISGSIYLFEEWYISIESSRHGEFLKKKWWLWHMHFKQSSDVNGT